ncbi:MAG TPA: hypothetical protein PLK34_02715, partial [Candidatus Pacearchaeota archaeon]|nr:hypothetical protein [Candidatus Pacearchaeota archaeon]
MAKQKKSAKKVKGKQEETKKEQETQKKDVAKRESPVETKAIVIFLIIIIALASFAFLVKYLLDNSKKINYQGVEFLVEKHGNIIFYHTTVPYLAKNASIPYNFWIRNNPKALEKNVPFNGTLYIRPLMGMKTSEELQCGGDGVIATANLANLYEALGVKVLNDPNATCDNYGENPRYVFVNIQPANETSIQETAPGCYNINVKDCKILPATER